MREAKPESKDLPFGGMSVVLMGDYGQLPPVKDKAIFERVQTEGFRAKGCLTYQLFDSVIEFDQVMRQSDSDQNQFRDILHKQGEGQLTLDDWKILEKRDLQQVSEEEKDDFKHSAVKLCATNRKLKSFNIRNLRSLSSPKAILKAKCTGTYQAKTASASAAGGLQYCTVIAEGCKVMLTRNLWKEAGLVNGSIGFVHKIVYKPGKSPCNEDLPELVYCRFEEYQGPPLFNEYPKVVPIGPQMATWMDGKTSCSRKQIPLVPAYSITIHKSQGMTMDKVIIDLGEKEFSVGLSYTAMSRVKRIQNLAFDPMPSLKRLTQFSNWKVFKERIEEDKRLKKLEDKTVVEYQMSICDY